MTDPAAPSIRRIRPDETDAVAALWRRSRIAAEPSLAARVPHTADEDLERFRDHVAREFEVWVAERDGRVAGFVALSPGRVDYLYVDTSDQRRGVGTALLAHAKALSPAGLRLFTNQGNRAARAFYAARGFRVARFGVSPPPESEPDVELEWKPPRV